MLSFSRSDESKVIDNILKEARIQKKSVEFSSEEALKKYLKSHPKADPKKHKVKQKDETGGKEDGHEPDKKNLIDSIEKKKKEIKKKKSPFDSLSKSEHADADALQADFEKNYNVSNPTLAKEIILRGNPEEVESLKKVYPKVKFPEIKSKNQPKKKKYHGFYDWDE